MAGEEIVRIGSGDLESEVRHELDRHLGGDLLVVPARLQRPERGDYAPEGPAFCPDFD
jgi:hypothetical protein